MALIRSGRHAIDSDRLAMIVDHGDVRGVMFTVHFNDGTELGLQADGLDALSAEDLRKFIASIPDAEGGEEAGHRP